MSQGKPANDSTPGGERAAPKALSPAWLAFIRFCGDLRYGEIERLSIQDGVPVLAELTKKKVKFTGEA